MTSKVAIRSLVLVACAALLAGGLGGCGGGGSGSGNGQPTSSPPTLGITSLNSDAVGHFAAVAALSLPISWLSDTSVSLTGGTARSAPLAGRFALLQPFRSLTQAGAGRSRALEVVNTGDVPCNFGGTMSATIDDVDNSGDETPGDVETLQFKNCSGTPDETYMGAIRLDVVEVTGDSTRYNVTLTQLSYVTPKHSLTFNGSYEANGFATVDSVQTTTLTVKGPLTVAVATHVPYADTVTLGNGFLVQDRIDYGAGRNVLSATGRVESVSAGGSVDVSTLSNLTTTRSGLAGMYPEAGVLQVKGKTGALKITALSSATVCVDTDSNDDGAIESTNTQSWDWLL